MPETTAAINELYPETEHPQIKAEREIFIGHIKDQLLRNINPELATILEKITSIFAQTRRRIHIHYANSKVNIFRIETEIDVTTSERNQLTLKVLKYPFTALADIAACEDLGIADHCLEIELTENSFSVKDTSDNNIKSNVQTLEYLLREFEHRLTLAVKAQTPL